MMKSSTYKLLLCLVVSFFITASAFATDRYVNGQVGGESLGLYATLQAALDDAVPGDTIYVYGEGEVPMEDGDPIPGADPGLASYPGIAVVYDDDIAILGVGDPLFQGTGSGNCITANGRTDISVRDLSIDDYAQGLRMGVTNGDFTGLAVTGCQYGLYILGTTSGLNCDGNTFNDNNAGGAGIVLNGANVTVTGCTLMGNANGILIGTATGMDVSGNTIKNSNDWGINVTGNALGDIYDNNVQLNDGGIRVGYNYMTAGATRDLEIYNNCIGDNTSYAAYDAYNTWGSPYPCAWHASGGPGNYYGTFYTGTPTDYYVIPGAGNWGKFPLTATNNPDGPAAVALGESFSVDFVFTIPELCAPFQNLKSCHFVVSYPDDLMTYDGGGAGDYLPNVQEIIQETSPGNVEVDLTALGDGYYATDQSGILATLDFTALADAVGTDQITVSSTYHDKDGVLITVTSAPLDIEVADEIYPEIRVANLINSPTLNATYSSVIPPTLEWTVWDDFDLELFRWRLVDDLGAAVTGHGWRYVVSPHPDGAGEVSGETEYDRDLSALASGTYYMELQLKDAAGHEVLFDFAKSGALAFTLDNTAPTKPTFDLADSDGCADDGWTGNLLVDATITSTHDASTEAGTAQWAYYGDPRDVVPFGAFQITLDDGTSPPDEGDGTHTVYLQLTDIYGNVGPWSDGVAIEVDRTAPDADLSGYTADFGFNIVDPWPPGETKNLTNTAEVEHFGNYNRWQYAYSIDDVVDGSGDLTCTGASWVDVPPSPRPYYFNFDLPDGPDGDFEVCFVVRDHAGNMSEIVCDDIYLDRTAPCATTLEVTPNNGMPCDDVYGDGFDITVSGFTEDPSHVRFRAVSTEKGTSAWSTPWTAASADPLVTSWVIPAGVRYTTLDGDYTIEVEIKDLLGNKCATLLSDVITYEHVSNPPTATTLELDGNTTAFWTNSDEVVVTVPDASDDVVEIAVCDAATSGGCDPSAGTWDDFDGTDPASSVAYTLTGAQCDKDYVHVKLRDCGGNETSALVLYVRYDLVAPVITAVEINSGDAKTDDENVTFDVTVDEACHSGTPKKYMVSEDGDFSGAAELNWGAGPPFSHTFSDDSDGDKYLHVKVMDYAGNWSDAGVDDIYLDKTPPTGTITLVANATCGAAAGYTCTRTDNILEFSGVSADVEYAKVRLPNQPSPYPNFPPDYGYPGFPGTNVWFAFDPATMTDMVWPWLDQGGADGNKYVEVKFQDEAGNKSGWISAVIYYDATAPTWSSQGFSARPADGEEKEGWGHSILCEWDTHPDAQYYGLNWQRTTDHPEYDVPFPAYPPTIDDEFPANHAIAGTSYLFETVALPEIFFLSLFVQDMAGNWSTNKLTDVTTNYYLGDFGEVAEDLMGGLRIEDFEEMKFNYFSPTPTPYDPLYDIGPTHDGTIYGYPDQDDAVNYEDLFTFTFVYDVHALTGKGAILPHIDRKPLPGEGLILSAELPSEFHTGQEFDAVVRINDPAPVKVMSLTFDYDTELLEAVSIQPGDMFSSDDAFLLNCIQGSSILMDGTILGADNMFEGSEVAVIHFHARSSGSFEFADPKMIFRDRSNEDIEVLFSNVVSMALPDRFALAQNYPNPFNPTTTIELSLPTACDWSCDIYNVAGQIVKSVSGYNEAGMVPITWDGTDASGKRVASGIYFYRINADSGRFVETKKMVLMK